MEITEAVVRGCSVENVFLEISQNLQENTCARLFFNKKKESLAQVFSCEFCEISKNTFFYRKPQEAASKIIVFKEIRDNLTNFPFNF